MNPAVQTSALSGVTGAGGVVALSPVGREHRTGRGLVLGMESVLGRKKKRGDARRGPVHHGVHGVTGQAVQHHVEKDSEIALENVDPLQVILIVAQDPPLSLRCVTLAPVKDGVAGHHGAPALCPVVSG